MLTLIISVPSVMKAFELGLPLESGVSFLIAGTPFANAGSVWKH